MGTVVLLLGMLALFAGIATTIVLAGSMLKERSQISASLAAIEAISGPVPDDMRQVYDKSFDERVLQPAQAWMAHFARMLSGANWAAKTNRRLDAAGNPRGWDAERVLAWKMIAAVGFGALVGGMLLLSGRFLPAILWGAAFAVFGFFLPDLLIINKAQHRSEAVRRALPDTIDLLTISVESGLAFDAAMSQVARNTDGPLADEFTRVLKEVQIGSSRSDALRGLSERTDVDDLQIFLNSMVQAEKLGIPIAEVLRVQTREIRIKRTQRIEEQAMKLPVKMVFPVMFCIMPSIFIVILGPAVLSIVDALS